MHKKLKGRFLTQAEISQLAVEKEEAAALRIREKEETAARKVQEKVEAAAQKEKQKRDRKTRKLQEMEDRATKKAEDHEKKKAAAKRLAEQKIRDNAVRELNELGTTEAQMKRFQEGHSDTFFLRHERLKEDLISINLHAAADEEDEELNGQTLQTRMIASGGRDKGFEQYDSHFLASNKSIQREKEQFEKWAKEVNYKRNGALRKGPNMLALEQRLAERDAHLRAKASKHTHNSGITPQSPESNATDDSETRFPHNIRRSQRQTKKSSKLNDNLQIDGAKKKRKTRADVNSPSTKKLGARASKRLRTITDNQVKVFGVDEELDD